MAGRPFDTFVLDVGHADGNIDLDALATADLLEFAGIPTVIVPVTPIAVHVAEKLHAYTRIYEGGRASTRVKDLVDLALIAHEFVLDAAQTRRAIDRVFATRATHSSPRAVPLPPEDWRGPFRALASTVGLDDDLVAGHRAVAAALDPVLQGRIVAGTWGPDAGKGAAVTTRSRSIPCPNMPALTDE